MEALGNFQEPLLLIIKIGIILFLLLYVIFAGVVIRQVRVMTETINVGFDKPLKLVAFFHFIFSLVVLFMSLILM